MTPNVTLPAGYTLDKDEPQVPAGYKLDDFSSIIQGDAPPVKTDQKEFEESVVPPVPKKLENVEELDLNKILKPAKEYQTQADFTKDGLPDVNAYNQYLATESKQQFSARKEAKKKEAEAGYTEEVAKLNAGDYKSVKPDKLSGAFQELGVKPSDATLSQIKKYADTQARSIPERVQKLDELGKATQSSVDDFTQFQKEHPNLPDIVNQLSSLETAYKNENDPAKKNELANQFNQLRADNAEVLSTFDKKQTASKALFDQLTTAQADIKNDTRQLAGLDAYYGETNFWYDRNKSLTENLNALGHSIRDASDLGFAKVASHLDAMATIIAGATGTKKGGVFENISNKLKENVAARMLQDRDAENVNTKFGGGLGGLFPMVSEIALTPEFGVGKVVVPKFVTYMGATGALDKFNENVDKLKANGQDYETAPLSEKLDILKETGKAGAIGLGEGIILHGLTMGANRYGGSLPARAVLSGGAFAGYDAVKSKIQGRELNDKDLIASFLVGTTLQAQGELTIGSPEKQEAERLKAQKLVVDMATKNPTLDSKVIGAWLEVTPTAKEQLAKIQAMPEGGEKAEKLQAFRDQTLKDIPDSFRLDYMEESGVIDSKQKEILKLAQDKTAVDQEAFDKGQPKGIADFRNLINTYQIGKDVQGLKNFVQDAQTVEATPAELLEIQKIMDNDWTDFVRLKSAGEAMGADRTEWENRMKKIFGDGNTTLMTVMGRMTSRQRALLLLKLGHTTTGQILKPEGEPGITTEPGLHSGETAEIPVEGGGKFKVPLLQKVMHVITGKTLKDIYGFNYNKADANPGRAYWQMSRETNRNAMTNEDLGDHAETAEEMRIDAETEPDEDKRQQQRLAAQMIEQVVAINKEAKNIASNPDFYIRGIANDPNLSQEQKDLFYKMVDDAVQNKGSLGAQAAQLIKELDELQMEIATIPSGTGKLEREAQAGILRDNIDAKTSELKDLYKNYVTAKEKADELLAQDAAEAEQKANEQANIQKLADAEAAKEAKADNGGDSQGTGKEEPSKGGEEQSPAEREGGTEDVGEKEEVKKNAEGFVSIPISELSTDLENMQGRNKEYSKQTFNRIVNEAKSGELNKSAIPPIQIWRNPKGDWVILGGHSRTAAFTSLAAGEHELNDKFKPADFDSINAQIVEADTLEEAKKIAQESNYGAQQTDLENAKRIQDMREEHKGAKAEFKEKLKDLFGSNAARLEKLSYLNPDGKTMQALKQFEDANESDNTTALKKYGSWIGEARRRFPELTDQHENEMYDFLTGMDRSKPIITDEATFMQKISGITSNAFFKPEEPLNLARIKHTTAGESEYDAQKSALQERINAKEAEIDNLSDRFNNPNNKAYVNPNTPDYADLVKRAAELKEKANDELKALRKEMLELQQNKGNIISAGLNQGGLFDTPVQKAVDELQQMFNPPKAKKVQKFEDIDGLDDLLGDFMNAKEPVEDYSEISPEKIKKGQVLVKKFLSAGITDYKAMIDYVNEKYGSSVAEDLFEPLKFIYLGLRGTVKPELRKEMTPAAELEELTYDKIKDYVSSTNRTLEPDSNGGEPEKPVGPEAVSNGPGTVAGADETGRGGLEQDIQQQDNSSLTTSTPVIIGTHGHTELFEQEQLQGIDADLPEGGISRAGSTDNEQGYEDEQQGSGESEDGFDDRVGKELSDKIREQKRAEGTKYEPGLDNIKKSLPLLLPHQHENVQLAEKRFFEDKQKGFGIFDGTGTGKGLSGLGIAKRFLQMGKKNILVVAPSDKKVADWVEEAGLLNIKSRALEDTKDGKNGGVVVTTHANMRQNKAIERDWDLVLYDEAHNLNSNEKGANTEAENKHRLITGAPEVVRSKYEAAYSVEEAKAKGIPKEAREELINKLVEEELQKTKVVFLTATPFAWHKNLRYADGYLFDMGGKDRNGAYNEGSSSDHFYMSNFGYRMRYNKLTMPESGVDVGLMERNFHENLKKTGAIIASRPQVETDYERSFLLVGKGEAGKLGAEMDRGLSLIYDNDEYRDLSEAVRKKWNYLYTQRVLEAIKAREIIPTIMQAVDNGEKVVVFHKYNEGLPSHPFDFSDPALYFGMEERKQKKALEQWRKFRDENTDLVNMDLKGLKNPIATLTEALGDDAVLFNGNVPKKQRRNNVDDFNNDASGKNVIIVNLAAGEAGLNLHDVKGTKPRVTFQLGLPTRPTSAIQTEGRTVRYGMKSNAKLIYPVLHFNYEKWAFGDINNRSRTVENLAMGESARNLETAYKDGYINPVDSYSDITGTGGKEADSKVESMDEFDKAKTYYFAKQKKTSKTKSFEGTDYFATPEPLGFKMVQWTDPKPNDAMLEPSAGHGGIGRFFPGDTKNKFIEPSRQLNADLSVVISGGDVINDTFENHYIGNKYEGIVMNPPFGHAGKTAIDHLAKAAEHLKDGGRVTGIFPVGAFDAKMDKWLNETDNKGRPVRPDIHLKARILLPSVTFERAGTQVMTQVLVFDKGGEAGSVYEGDLRDIKKIGDLFDAIKDLNIPSKSKTGVVSKPNFDEAKIDKPIASLDRFPHSKTGDLLHVVGLNSYIGPGKFAEYKQIAKELGGYWSSFKGAGAKPGFLFKNEADAVKLRDKILQDQNGVQEPKNEYLNDIQKSIEDGTISQQRADAFLSQSAEKIESIEPAVEAIESKAASDNEATLAEAITEADNLINQEQLSLFNVSPELAQHITQEQQTISYGDKTQKEEINKAAVGEIHFSDGTILRNSNLVKDFKEKNRIDVGNYKFNPKTFALDAANLFAQVRSPLIEKMGVMYYLPNGQVIHAELHTLGLVDATNLTGGDYNETKKEMARIINFAHKSGAKGFVLAHNHPSGNNKPSFADIQFTKALSDMVDDANKQGVTIEFGGHVITDSNKFTFVDNQNNVSEHDYEAKDFKLSNYPTLLSNASDPQGKMLEYSKQITEGGYTKAIVYADSKMGLRGFEMIPDNMTDAELGSHIANGMKMRGAAGYVITHDGTFTPNKELPNNNLDVIEVKEGKAKSLGQVTGPDNIDRKYERLQEDTEAYHPSIPPDVKAKALEHLSDIAKDIQQREGLTGQELADAVKDKLRSIDLGHISHLVDEMDLPDSEAVQNAITPPFAKEFFDHDVLPKLQGVVQFATAIPKLLIRAYSPRTGVATKTIDEIMKVLGGRNKSEEVLDGILHDFEKEFDKMPDSERIDFIDKIKTGTPQPTPELQVIADMLRGMDDDLYKELAKYKPTLSWKEDHFRVLWKVIPGSTKAGFKGIFRKPFQGTKGFMKQATLIDMSEGINKGGVPYTTNPIRMFKTAYADAMKYITAQKMWAAFKNLGLRKFVRFGSEVPAGFERLDDTLARVYFPVTEGMVNAGEWFVEEGAARLLNNHLSKDYLRDSSTPLGVVGKGLMEIKNVFTAVELGLSAFHAVAESFEVASSQIGLGLRQLINLGLHGNMEGLAKGIANIVTAPISPATTAITGRSTINHLKSEDFRSSAAGARFLKNFPNADQYIDDFFNGGGKFSQSADYHLKTMDVMKEMAGKDNYIGAALRVLPVMNEMIMQPLFNYYIPALKVGMFMKEFPVSLLENQKAIASGKTTREQVARKTVDFIDDRLGEMNFDNLFWDRTFKTAHQFMLRSVTWKLGNLRAMAGAPIEQGLEMINAVKEKRAPNLSPKMAWLFGLVALQTAFATVLMQMFTGKKPEDMRDIAAPQIDPKDPDQRIILPTYMKDVIHAHHDPVGYVTGSMSGEIGKALDIMHNKDFYNYEIYDPDASVAEKAKDIASYAIPKPFSITSYMKQSEKGEPFSKKALSFLGFVKAPQYLTNTPIENDIFDLYHIRNQGVKPKQQKEADALKKQVRDIYKLAQGKSPEEAQKLIDKAAKMMDDGVTSGVLQPTQVNALLKNVGSQTDASVYFFNRLPLSDRQDLWKRMNADERKLYDPFGKLDPAQAIPPHELTPVELALEKKKSLLKAREEAQQAYIEKTYGKVTDLEKYIKNRPSNEEKADLIIRELNPQLKELSNEDRRALVTKRLTELFNKKIISKPAYQITMSRLLK